MNSNVDTELKSTPARRAMYYLDYDELKRAKEAIGEAWFQQMKKDGFSGNTAALLGYLAGVADGKRAERARMADQAGK